MTARFPIYSGIKTAVLNGQDSTEVSSIRYAKFDQTEIPSGFGVSSTNGYQFVLDSGSSYILIGSTSMKNGTVSLQWYNETTSSNIGFKANLISGSNQRSLNPQYRKEAVAYIASSGSSITVSLRITTDSGSPNFAFEPEFNNNSGVPILQIIKKA